MVIGRRRLLGTLVAKPPAQAEPKSHPDRRWRSNDEKVRTAPPGCVGVWY
jgi:hypothetical protein